MSIEGHVSLPAQETEDSNRPILIAHSQVQPVWGGAQARDFLFQPLKDEDLKSQNQKKSTGVKWVTKGKVWE